MGYHCLAKVLIITISFDVRRFSLIVLPPATSNVVASKVLKHAPAKMIVTPIYDADHTGSFTCIEIGLYKNQSHIFDIMVTSTYSRNSKGTITCYCAGGFKLGFKFGPIYFILHQLGHNNLFGQNFIL